MQAEHALGAGELDERDALGVARLEADGRPRGDVQAHAEREGPVEPERAVHLEEVEVRADLDGPVPRVGHRELDRPASGVGDDVALAQEILAGNHALPPFTGSDGGP